jgi:hypothetical protein
MPASQIVQKLIGVIVLLHLIWQVLLLETKAFLKEPFIAGLEIGDKQNRYMGMVILVCYPKATSRGIGNPKYPN